MLTNDQIVDCVKIHTHKFAVNLNIDRALDPIGFAKAIESLANQEKHAEIGKLKATVDGQREVITDLEDRLEKAQAEFKNFHRALCERFNYCHDQIDWKRDQVSLIEHIANSLQSSQSQVSDQLIKGDYVLATKYSDGDPNDQWSVGFYDRTEGDRHYVVNHCRHQFRANGFRRVEKIRAKQAAKPKHSPLPEAPQAPASLPEVTPEQIENFKREFYRVTPSKRSYDDAIKESIAAALTRCTDPAQEQGRE